MEVRTNERKIVNSRQLSLNSTTLRLLLQSTNHKDTPARVKATDTAEVNSTITYSRHKCASISSRQELVMWVLDAISLMETMNFGREMM